MAKIRVYILIAAVLLSILAIRPDPFIQGVKVTYIAPNSLLSNLTASTSFNIGSIITAINGVPIRNVSQFYSIINSNAFTNQTINITYENEIFPYTFVSHTLTLFVSNSSPFNSSIISVAPVSNVNLVYGTDLVGGTIITLLPNSSNVTLIQQDIQVIQTRLNVYGISGIQVQLLSSFGRPTIQVILPLVSEGQALSLVSSRGVFVAKIGNITVINSSNESLKVLHVCTSPTCPYPPGEVITEVSPGDYQFQFGIYLSSGAANAIYNVVKTLPLNPQNPNYLSGSMNLYVNGKLVSSLALSASLRQSPSQEAVIEGSAPSLALAQENMKSLQAILQSGSLPVPLTIGGITYISPAEGSAFLSQIYLILVLEFVVVSLFTFVRYQDRKISAYILLTGISEIIIVLGIAAAIHWTLDIESFAGILASVGVAIDDQIIITDEVLRGSKRVEFASLGERISRAFFIIFLSFLLYSATMIPLMFATATLFTGFALTSVLAYLVGLLITRPAYGELITQAFEKKI
jgi:preprotein translocase subunit SecD